MQSFGKRVQKARVDKYLTDQRARLEYESAVTHAPEIMAQTEAVFLYALKLNGYGPKRLKKAHDDFISVLNMPLDLMGGKVTTESVKQLMENEYGIDFSRIDPKFPPFEEVMVSDT